MYNRQGGYRPSDDIIIIYVHICDHNSTFNYQFKIDARRRRIAKARAIIETV